jgi:hypothetical protein
MKTLWERIVTAAITGAAVAITLTITLTLIFGWRKTKESSKTALTISTQASSISTQLSFQRETGKEVEEGSAGTQQTSSIPISSSSAHAAGKSANEEHSPYVGGNYVAGRSTIRYIITDNQGEIEMQGYDLMHQEARFVGSGKMIGRKLTIPRFNSFLDNALGTLKLELSEDGKTFEGRFEPLDPTKPEARVVLSRLP